MAYTACLPWVRTKSLNFEDTDIALGIWNKSPWF